MGTFLCTANREKNGSHLWNRIGRIRSMPRKYKTPSTSIEEIRRRIDQQFEDAAFACLRGIFLTVLQDHDEAVQLGTMPAFGAIENLLSRYESLFTSRPSDRFVLDSWLIQNLAEGWSLGNVKLPNTILPVYGNEWMWQRLPWFEQPDGAGHRIYGITLKGRNQLSSVRLLEYPWICHELGHGLFSRCPAQFLQEFVDIVDHHCRPILRKAFSDSPEARGLTRDHVARLRQCWLPRGDQQSWIHELAVDFIALWSLGPAFLAAMTDFGESPQIDPFIVDSSHPPYSLRIGMLADCAKFLGWEKEAAPLAHLAMQWESRKLGLQNHNLIVGLTPAELAKEATTWIISGCRSWKIPRCDREILRTISERRSNRLPVDSATELIISAWLLFEENQETYPTWESLTLRSLCAELNGNA